jgi:peroxiredoxin Q/BCP
MPREQKTRSSATKAPKSASTKLEVGQMAPEFSLPSNAGKPMSLSDFRGKYVVLYFYPKDDTPGCTVEAKDFEAAAAEFEKRNAVILGVSKDTIESHQRFSTKYSLHFPLLSDPETSVIDAYGAWGEKNMYGKKSMGIIRTTVIIGPDGKVKKVFPKVKVAHHVQAVLDTLDQQT